MILDLFLNNFEIYKNTKKLDKISKELIIEALKEATYNGVSNMRYIEKILSDKLLIWNIQKPLTTQR